MIVAWSDVGSPREVGDYEVEGLVIRVDQDALSVWRDRPATTFEVVRERVSDGTFAFVLDAGDMPESVIMADHLCAKNDLAAAVEQ